MKLISLRKDQKEWIDKDTIIRVFETEEAKRIYVVTKEIMFDKDGGGNHHILSDYTLGHTLGIINGTLQEGDF